METIVFNDIVTQQYTIYQFTLRCYDHTQEGLGRTWMYAEGRDITSWSTTRRFGLSCTTPWRVEFIITIQVGSFPLWKRSCSNLVIQPSYWFNYRPECPFIFFISKTKPLALHYRGSSVLGRNIRELCNGHPYINKPNPQTLYPKNLRLGYNSTLTSHTVSCELCR